MSDFHKVTVTESVTSIELRLLEGTVSAVDAANIIIKKTEYICSSDNCRNNFYCKKCSFARNIASINTILKQYGIDLDEF